MKGLIFHEHLLVLIMVFLLEVIQNSSFLFILHKMIVYNLRGNNNNCFYNLFITCLSLDKIIVNLRKNQNMKDDSFSLLLPSLYQTPYQS